MADPTAENELKLREAGWQGLTDRVIESMRLEKLSNRQLVLEVAHSELADIAAVEEMMIRLFPEWVDFECPPDCELCKRENGDE